MQRIRNTSFLHQFQRQQCIEIDIHVSPQNFSLFFNGFGQQTKNISQLTFGIASFTFRISIIIKITTGLQTLISSPKITANFNMQQ